MRTPILICVFAAGTIGLTGCGSGEKTDSATSAASSSVPASTTSAAPGTTLTIAEYLRQKNIRQTMVKRGDPGAPRLNLPMPAGWADVGRDTPPDAYGAIYLQAPGPTPNPPAIIARMARLDGDVDVAKLLEYAPTAVTRAPGWEGPTTGRPSTLDGFDAVQIAGTATIDGAPTFVARKTVVITAPKNVYLLALDAQGPVDQTSALIDAMTVIDERTTIQP